MNYAERIQDSIDYMSQSTDVEDWNERRSQIIGFMDDKDIAQYIDSGLIVKILGKDKPEDYKNREYEQARTKTKS